MRIKEVSENYGITPHTLRYYERRGLISPEYSDNGYRKYSYEDIQRLNTIRDLRYFDLSLSEIQKYLDDKNLELTKNILLFEIKEINVKIKELKVKKNFLKDRIEMLEFSEKKRDFEIECTNYKDRHIILSEEKDIPGKKLYFELKRLHKNFEKELSTSNQNVFGTIFDEKEGFYRHQVFYCLDEKIESKQYKVLPEGKYLSIYYKGNHKNRRTAVNKINQYIQKNKIKAYGIFYEYYLLDSHETNISSEYVSKIEVLIE